MTDMLIQSNANAFRGATILNAPSLDLFQGTATAVGTTSATTFANGDFLFKIAGLTSETVQIQGSTDGGVTWSAALVPWVDSTMLTAVSTGLLPNGQYRLLFVQMAGFTAFRFVKSSTVETVTVVFTFPKFTIAG